ncbi:uncharacterized protein LOC102802015 [Saccoglossus kowalevskii]
MNEKTNIKARIVLNKLPNVISPAKTYPMKEVEKYCSPNKAKKQKRRSIPSSSEICAKKVLKKAKRQQSALGNIFMSPGDEEDFQETSIKFPKRKRRRPTKTESKSTARKIVSSKVHVQSLRSSSNDEIGENVCCPTCHAGFTSTTEMQTHVTKCLKNKFSNAKGTSKASRSLTSTKRDNTESIDAEKQKNRESSNKSPDLKTTVAEYNCQICEKDLTHMTEIRRAQHVNQCLDKSMSSCDGTSISSNTIAVKTVKSKDEQSHVIVAKESTVPEPAPQVILLDEPIAVHPKEKVCCVICQKDLSHMVLKCRDQHMNKCIDLSAGQSSASDSVDTTATRNSESKTENSMSGILTTAVQCPVCSKDIQGLKAPEVHVKKCALKNKVTTVKLLKMVKEQKETPITVTVRQKTETIQQKTKIPKQRQLKPPSSLQDEQLSLAKAMSLSLTKDDQKGVKKGRKKDNKEATIPRLVLVTPEEVQKAVTERLSAIITQSEFENYEDTPPLMKSKFAMNSDATQLSCQLWKLTGQNDPSDTTPLKFYVADLKPIISPVKKKKTPKIKTPKKIKDGNDEDMSTQELGRTVHILAQLADEGLIDSSSSSMSGISSIRELTLQSSIQNEYQQMLIGDLAKMINNPHFSDVIINIADGESLYCHSFMLASRSDKLAKVLNATETRNEDGKLELNWTKWTQFSFDAVFAFLKFLYTAELDIPVNFLNDVSEIADRFKVTQLQSACKELIHGIQKVASPQHNDTEDSDSADQKTDSDFVEKDVDELLNSLWGNENSSDNDSQSSNDDNETETYDRELEDVYKYMSTQRARNQTSSCQESKLKSHSPQNDNQISTAAESSSDEPAFNSGSRRNNPDVTLTEIELDTDNNSDNSVKMSSEVKKRKLSPDKACKSPRTKVAKDVQSVFCSPVREKKSFECSSVSAITPDLFGGDDDDSTETETPATSLGEAERNALIYTPEVCINVNKGDEKSSATQSFVKSTPLHVDCEKKLNFDESQFEKRDSSDTLLSPGNMTKEDDELIICCESDDDKVLDMPSDSPTFGIASTSCTLPPHLLKVGQSPRSSPRPDASQLTPTGAIPAHMSPVILLEDCLTNPRMHKFIRSEHKTIKPVSPLDREKHMYVMIEDEDDEDDNVNDDGDENDDANNDNEEHHNGNYEDDDDPMKEGVNNFDDDNVLLVPGEHKNADFTMEDENNGNHGNNNDDKNSTSTEDDLCNSSPEKKVNSLKNSLLQESLNNTMMDFDDDGGYNMDFCAALDQTVAEQSDSPHAKINAGSITNNDNIVEDAVDLRQCLGESFNVNDLDLSLMLPNSPEHAICEERSPKQPNITLSEVATPSSAVPRLESAFSGSSTPNACIETPGGPVTPMPMYYDMNTPLLKGELHKFGVRPLPRKKAVILLKNIYDFTHQGKLYQKAVLPTNPSTSVTNENIVKAKIVDQIDEPVDESDTDKELDNMNSSQNSDSDDGDDFGESILVGDDESDEDLTASQQASEADKPAQVKNYIKTRKDWYLRILQYECITFRTQSNKGRNRRTKKKKKVCNVAVKI